MSRTPWVAPDWMAAEDREREDTLMQSLRRVLIAARAAAFRLDTAAEVSGWQARMTGATSDADEWAARFERLAPMPQETPQPPAEGQTEDTEG